MEIIKSILLWNTLILGALSSSFIIYLIVLHSIQEYKLWKERRNFKPPF